MKNSLAILVGTLFLHLLCHLHVVAQEPEKAVDFFDPLDELTIKYSPKQIRIVTEFFEMSAEDALELLDHDRFSVDDVALRQELIRRMNDDRVTLLNMGMITARPGESATTESVEEHSYPSAYSPPQMATEVKIPDGATVEEIEKLRFLLTTPPLPSSFQTRKTGLVFEAEPSLSNLDSIIDLRFAPELTYHVGKTVFQEWRDDKRSADVTMPLFYTIRINTSLTARDQVPLMAAVISPKNDKGVTDPSRKVMVFVKCTIRAATKK